MITDVQLASVTATGTQASRDSVTLPSSLSADGRYVALQSAAANLVAGGTNGYGHIFLKDMESGTISQVSTNSNGTQANYFSNLGSVSADGQRVAFSSGATNLDGGHRDGTWDVLVKDLATGVLINASTSATGALANWYAYGGSLSGDGRLVAFESNATNLVAGDTVWTAKIFVKDLGTGWVVNASTNGSGGQANGESHDGHLSADGQHVVYSSKATNLVAGDANGVQDVFVKNLVTGAVVNASTDATGVAGNGQSTANSITADGRAVAFTSAAANLVANDGNGQADIFVKDLVTGSIVNASVGADGGQANGASSGASLSADGRFVVFQSLASNLVAGDTNGIADIFVKDLRTGQIEMVTTSASGLQVVGNFGGPSISADGSHISYYSNANTLVAGDGNGSYDVFVSTRDVAALDAAPEIGPSRLSISENGKDAGTVQASDADADVLEFSITGGADANLFILDARSGALAFAAAPDYELPADQDHDNSYEIEVSVSDGRGGTTVGVVAVAVEDAQGIALVGTKQGDVLEGTAEADTLQGGGGGDRIATGGGDDVVNAGSGNDVVVAGHGLQVMTGGSGYDTLDFRGIEGDLTVNTGQHRAMSSGGPLAMDSFISSFEELIGNSGDGVYTGSRGSEHFTVSGGGENWFRGMGGADVFTGGDGADTFEFLKKDTRAGLAGEITNFEVGEDHLALADFLKGNFIKGATYEQVLSLVDVARADGGHDTMVRGLDGGHWIDIVKLDGLAASAITLHDLVLA